MNVEKVADLRQNSNPLTDRLAIDFVVPSEQLDRRLGLAGRWCWRCSRDISAVKMSVSSS